MSRIERIKVSDTGVHIADIVEDSSTEPLPDGEPQFLVHHKQRLASQRCAIRGFGSRFILF